MERPVDVNPGDKERVKIFTLGRFVIMRGSVILSDEAARSKKVWDLFKYLLAHQQKQILPEEILLELWPEQDYADPNLAMRTLIFRLRQLLAEGLSAPELAENITFSHGCYKWEPQNDCWLDVDIFEELCAEADVALPDAPEEAAAAYQRAVDLYKGVFLPESQYYEWAIPIRSYYHRLYVQIVLKLTELLKNDRRFAELIKLCEKALPIEYFEEEIHLRLIEALLEEGKEKKAMTHYEEVTSVFYREMGVKPSTAMQNIYRLIKLKNRDNFDLDLTFVQDALKERQTEKGPFVCDPEIFHHIYKLERQRGERNGQAVFLGMLTLTFKDFTLPPQQELQLAMDRLLQVLVLQLRKGDVVTRWNHAQFLLILPGLNLEQAEKVLQRLKQFYYSGNPATDKIILHSKQQSLLPLEKHVTR